MSVPDHMIADAFLKGLALQVQNGKFKNMAEKVEALQTALYQLQQHVFALQAGNVAFLQPVCFEVQHGFGSKPFTISSVLVAVGRSDVYGLLFGVGPLIEPTCTW